MHCDGLPRLRSVASISTLSQLSRYLAMAVFFAASSWFPFFQFFIKFWCRRLDNINASDKLLANENKMCCVFVCSMNTILSQVESQMEESSIQRRGSRAYQVHLLHKCLFLDSSAVTFHIFLCLNSITLNKLKLVLIFIT